MPPASAESGVALALRRDARLRAGQRAVLAGAIAASLGSLLFGFDTVVISGTNDALQKVFQLSHFWRGFTVAMALIGTIVGVCAAGKLADAVGRKNTLLLVAACYFVSALACFFVQSWWELLAARFIGGLAIGGTSVVTPMYIAEISPPRLRGRLVMINQLAIVLGIFFCFISNYVIACHYSFEVAWRWMFGVLAFPSIVFFLSIFWILESPRSLVKRGRLADARRSLGRLGEADVEGELAAIQASLADRPGHVQEQLFRHPHGRPLLLCFAVAVFNQLTGINAILYYTPEIFSKAGAGAKESLLQSIAIGGTLLLFTIVAMFVIDRFGRRILLLIGSVGMTLCLALVAAAFATAQGGSPAHPRLVLAGLIGSIAFFAMSQGAVTFVFISEVFPNAVRAKGQAFGTLVHWVMDTTVTWTFPVLAALSVAGVFGFFAVMMVLQFVFVWKIMPETKGAALEDLEKRLAGVD
ncbi:MAG: sugar porter family MFS transporter [Thermoguttaceae bacterium]